MELAEKHPPRPLGGQRGVWRLGEDVEWREGRAGAEKLPAPLAALPGEIVTKDSSDPDRAHELDPPHVVEAYEYEYQKAEREDATPKKLDGAALAAQMQAPIGEVVPCTQVRVDWVRWRVARPLLDRWVDALDRGENPDLDSPWHVWFPHNNVNEYELRKGLAPRSKDRPRHLRHVRLRVDPFRPPRSVRDLFELHGIPVPDAMSVVANAKTRLVSKVAKAQADMEMH